MRDTRFAKLWAGETVSHFGDRISELALPLIAVLMLAAGPFEVGLLTAAIWTPHLFGLLIGSWVDRRPHRRPLLVAADLLRAAALLSLPLAYLFGAVTLTQLFVVALLTGFGQVLFMSGYQTLYVSIVERSDYVSAGSKLTMSRSASHVAGPPLGGFLVQTLSAPVAVLADALSFVVSALLIARIPVPASPVRERASLLAEARAGLNYVREHRYLRAALACVTTVNFFTFIAQALVVLFAGRTLGLSGGLIGLALGVGALGGLTGALLAPRLSRRFGVGRVIVAGAVVFPAPIALIAFAGGPLWVVVTLCALVQAVSGFGVMLFDINLNAVQTAVTADHMRSRVTGVFSTINYGVRPLGAVTGGLLGEWLGLRPTLVVAGVGGALCCLCLLRSPIPHVRQVDDELALAA